MRLLPGWLRPYAISLAALAVVTGVTAAAQHWLGTPLPPVAGLAIGFSFVIVWLTSAWLGYGAGVMVCLLMVLVLPHLIVVARGLNGRMPANRFDFTRIGLSLAVSFLVSYIGDTRRRREGELLRHATELESRVREASEKLLASALERRLLEDRLRFVLDSAGVGYWDSDLRSGETSRSPRHDRLFGYAEPLSRWDFDTFFHHVHAEDRERVDREYRATLKGQVRPLEFRVVWPDGSLHWLWATAQTHLDADGQPAHLSGVTIDITARRLAEEEAREQARLLHLAHDAILTLDQEGHVLFWNPRAEQMYGYTREEATGRVVHDLLKTVFPEPPGAIEAGAREQGYWEGELTHTRKDGSKLVVASRWALRLGADGETLGFLEINTDITERRRIEEQLRHTQKLESLGVLAGGVAHDFNNLLTGILGNASLALDRTPATHSSYLLLEEVMHAAERAADLTRQLLAYAGKGRFVMRNIALSALVREISGLIQTSIPKPVHLRLHLDDAVPAVFGDPGQMQQIVMNLVINASEAIGPEGGMVLVRTGVQRVDQEYIVTMSSAGELLQPGDYVMLEVHDTGSGMSEETLGKIFDPFFTTKFAGRGLGLSAVLGIVRAHRGALKVYSQPGRGTTFKLLFPVSTELASTEAAPPAAVLEGHGTILVVDDEEVVRNTARHTLERYGYRAIMAENGLEAIDLYRRESGISLVLLDLTMPVMNGEETLRRLQTVDPGVRVVLTSGYNEVEALQRFTGKGLAGFIQKPFTASSLAERVKEILTQA